jgi:hypothetical protein
MKILIIAFLSPTLLCALALAGESGHSPASVGYCVMHDTTPPLRLMPLVQPEERVDAERENRGVPNPSVFLGWKQNGARAEVTFGLDPVVQRQPGRLSLHGTIVNMDGMGNLSGMLPPDPNSDVGRNHVIEVVNATYAIYSKTGALLFGPQPLRTIWLGMPYPADGDPIVVYDESADRWVISQFSFPNYPNGPGYMLLAISQTSDPLGSWYRYAFSFMNMPDYPKLAVWPDGYYMSANSFSFPTTQGRWLGPAAAVFERDSMLHGGAARMIFFQEDSTLNPMLPADPDGRLPPPGSPAYYIMAFDDAAGGGPDRLQLYQLQTNWTTPALSTFTALAPLLAAPFDMNLCSWSRNCIPQPGTTRKLDALANLLMNRLQYRNFGAYQTLVTNHTVDVDGSDHAGIRWYELRNAGSGWEIHHQGTYAPDGHHRWTGSAAMDGLGNIALGYSISSDSLFASLRATARREIDPPGVMTFREEPIVTGGGAQGSTESRWGDYSMLAVDPVDSTTFWYTGEYYATGGQSNWKTRIASFKVSDLTGSVTEESSQLPGTFTLYQNFPNPFNPSTTIRYELPRDSRVSLKIFDVLGREVATLVNEEQKTGFKSVVWDATGFVSGVYFCRLQAGGYTSTKKLLLQR